MRKFIILSILCLFFVPSNGQYYYINKLEKYWNYRYRLLGDEIDPNFSNWETGFVRRGIGAPGLSLVSDNRQNVVGVDNNWHVDFKGINPDQPRGGACMLQGISPIQMFPSPNNPTKQTFDGIQGFADAPTDLGK